MASPFSPVRHDTLRRDALARRMRQVGDFEILEIVAEHRRLRAALPLPSRFFEGHFPGRPVLPAVAQLALLDVLLRHLHGREARIVELVQYRLLSPVLPGEEVQVHLHPSPPGAVAAFELERGDARISEGRIRWVPR